LPLFVLANWRGFSGGMRDMYEEVLKFGAMIVDNLRTFKQPVFVYIPPKAELRGGAWVVVDPTINPDMMEMCVAVVLAVVTACVALEITYSGGSVFSAGTRTTHAGVACSSPRARSKSSSAAKPSKSS
jgi:acetyl-CoA carboxylase carboxyltransferase component